MFDDCKKATGFRFTFGKAPLIGESPYTLHEGIKFIYMNVPIILHFLLFLLSMDAVFKSVLH